MLMNVLVTGGDTPWGYSLVHGLVRCAGLVGKDGVRRPIGKIVLLNTLPRPAWRDERIERDPRVVMFTGDIGDAAMIEQVMRAHAITSIFHTETLVREVGEDDLDGMWRINVMGTRNLLEAARKIGNCPKIVFDSSLSVYADRFEGVAVEGVKLLPSSTYGTSKAIGELLINDYSRRGYVDGKSSLLPGGLVAWRPMRRSDADAVRRTFLWPFAKDPFSGEPIALNLRPDTIVHFNGHHTLVANLIELHDLPSDALGADRACILPAISSSVQAVLDTLRAVADELGLAMGPVVDRFRQDRQDEIDDYVKRADDGKARALGLSSEDMRGVILNYVQGLRDAGIAL